MLAFVNMEMSMISPLELYKALIVSKGMINTVLTLFKLDHNLIETFVVKYKNAFDYFSSIKQSNEIVFSEVGVWIYKYSQFIPIKADLMNPENPTIELSGNLKERVHDNEGEEDMLDSNKVIDGSREEEHLQDEDILDFRYLLANCAVITSPLQECTL